MVDNYKCDYIDNVEHLFKNDNTKNDIFIKNVTLIFVSISENKFIFMIDDKFHELIPKKKIDSGSNGYVYFFTYKKKNKFVLKFPKPKNCLKIKYEEEILKKINNNNVVQSVGKLYDKKISYIIMEHMHGNLSLLNNQLKKIVDDNLIKYYNIVLNILDKILDGLISLQETGYGYSDMKPSNILFKCKKNNFIVKFGDIGGIAKLNEYALDTTIMQIIDKKEIKINNYTSKGFKMNNSFNIWQFGVIAYHYLCGIPNDFTYKNLASYLDTGSNKTKIMKKQKITMVYELIEKIKESISPIFIFLHKTLPTNEHDTTTLSTLSNDIKKLYNYIDENIIRNDLKNLKYYQTKNYEQAIIIYNRAD